eukprot:365469-Chlamydomonas_euryale.AAC.23
MTKRSFPTVGRKTLQWQRSAGAHRGVATVTEGLQPREMSRDDITRRHSCQPTAGPFYQRRYGCLLVAAAIC